MLFNFCVNKLSETGVGVGITVALACHVGHMEQHSGTQEAAGFSAGKATAAAERPRTIIRGYARARKWIIAGQQLTVVFVIK